MKVYAVLNLVSEEILGVYTTPMGAQHKAATFIFEESGQSENDILEVAQDNGYDTLEEFKEALYRWPDYNEDFEISIQERELED